MDEAAAPHATLVVIVVAAVIAAVLLLPSLSLLYGLLLGGRFEREAEPDEAGERRAIRIGRWEVRVGAAASVFIAGALLNIFCQNAWQRGVAVAALLGGIAWGFALLAVPPEAPEHEDGQRGD